MAVKFNQYLAGGVRFEAKPIVLEEAKINSRTDLQLALFDELGPCLVRIEHVFLFSPTRYVTKLNVAGCTEGDGLLDRLRAHYPMYDSKKALFMLDAARHLDAGAHHVFFNHLGWYDRENSDESKAALGEYIRNRKAAIIESCK